MPYPVLVLLETTAVCVYSTLIYSPTFPWYLLWCTLVQHETSQLEELYLTSLIADDHMVMFALQQLIDGRFVLCAHPKALSLPKHPEQTATYAQVSNELHHIW